MRTGAWPLLLSALLCLSAPAGAQNGFLTGGGQGNLGTGFNNAAGLGPLEPAITLSATQPRKQVHRCKPGPWGTLEYYHTYLEAPGHIMDLVNTPSARTVWFFPDKDLGETRELFSRAGISEEDQDEIFRNSLPYQVAPPYRFYPSPGIVENLSPDGRVLLYSELRQWVENPHHRTPVVIESGDVREWFAGSGLHPETIALIEKVSYRMGRTLFFSDPPLVLSRLVDDREERDFLKALSRTRSLILRLRIPPGSDFGQISQYWMSGGKNQEALPLIESIGRTPGVDHIDVAHLLPPIPRKHLYSFPSFSLGIEGIYPDGFWASLNFFRVLPDDSFNDPEVVAEFVPRFYEHAEQPYTFGDIIAIRDPASGRLTHSCVFIADDIVYTKNGRSLLRPFMFMKMDDLLKRHVPLGDVTIEVWRKKDREATEANGAEDAEHNG